MSTEHPFVSVQVGTLDIGGTGAILPTTTGEAHQIPYGLLWFVGSLVDTSLKTAPERLHKTNLEEIKIQQWLHHNITLCC